MNNKIEKYIDTVSGKTLEKKIYPYNHGKIYREEYYFNGKYHREDGPAIIWYDKNGKVEIESYFLNAERHREDGPAWIAYNRGKITDKEYWIRGIEISDPLQLFVLETLENVKKNKCLLK